MGVIVEAGVGGYAVDEKWQVWRPAPMPARPPLLVLCHGAASHGWYYGEVPVRGRLCRSLAMTGIVCIAADLGNADPDNGPLTGTWGTPLSVQRVWELVDWSAGRWGVDPNRVLLLGDSAGGATALNALRAEPDRVSACCTRLGITNIDAEYTMGNPLITQLIDEAYGGDWSSAKATSDPALNLGDFEGHQHKIRLYYSVDDGLVPAWTVTDFAEAVGCRAVPIGEVGHDAELSYPAFPDHDIARFFWWRYPAA